MGKYSSVTPRLPKLATEEPSYQEKINETKREIIADPEFQQHASTLAKMYTDLRRGTAPDSLDHDDRKALITALGKEGLQELLSECSLQLTAVEQLLIEQYENESTTSLKLETGESISIQVEPYASVQDKETYRLWCLEEGFEHLMTVPWTTTNSETKRRLLEGLPPPPGVAAFAVSKIVLRKA